MQENNVSRAVDWLLNHTEDTDETAQPSIDPIAAVEPAKPAPVKVPTAPTTQPVSKLIRTSTKGQLLRSKVYQPIFVLLKLIILGLP